MKTRFLTVEDRNYLKSSTSYIDKIWTFFTPHTKIIPDQSNLSLSSIPLTIL